MKNDSYSDDNLFNKYFKEINRINFLTREEEIELAKRIEKGDKTARKKFIVSNLGLVIYFSKRYRKYLSGSNLSFFDLILEGNLGLIDAVEKFDWRQGCRFSTFAKERILNSIRKALCNKSRTIRISKEQLWKLHNLRKSFEKLSCKLESSSNPNSSNPNKDKQNKIVAKMNLLGEKLEKLHEELPLNILSLQYPIVSDDGDSLLLGDFIENSESVPIEEQLSQNELAKKVRYVLSSLSPREEKIIRLRFGIGEKSEHTLGEIGKRFGMSRQRIDQIKSKIFRKLRGNKEFKKLRII